MNLDIYKEEILRRSEQRIKKRKKLRNRVLALCIPLALLAATVLINPPLAEQKTDLAGKQEAVTDAESFSSDSIFCSFVQAQIYVDGEAVTVTDKLTVDKLFTVAAFADGDNLYGAAISEDATEADSDTEPLTDQLPTLNETSSEYCIIFTTADGTGSLYFLTQEQYEEILEVLK